MASLYLWTEQEPPTRFSTVSRPFLLDAAHQEEWVEAVRSVDGMCLVTRPWNEQFWSNAPDAMNGPVLDYVHHWFVPIAKFGGGYQLLKRKGSA
jgi:hypothetical protein